ncbi:MAG: peptidase Ste24p, partial [Acidobacteria bacterium]|nr:peptidase Ste24p [Acidobacteriota bacterium]
VRSGARLWPSRGGDSNRLKPGAHTEPREDVHRARPLALASALAKLQEGAQRIPIARGNPAHSHLFIVNPFMGGLQKLFSTHPPMEERIQRLRSMAGESRSDGVSRR